MGKLIGSFLDLLGGVLKFARNLTFLAVMFVMVVFVLTIIMPQNVQTAIEIFRNLLKIP